ncbi:hypothetical protein BDM02DRAFT_3123237, partial [Thelephora ganbajun]
MFSDSFLGLLILPQFLSPQPGGDQGHPISAFCDWSSCQRSTHCAGVVRVPPLRAGISSLRSQRSAVAVTPRNLFRSELKASKPSIISAESSCLLRCLPALAPHHFCFRSRSSMPRRPANRYRVPDITPPLQL